MSEFATELVYFWLALFYENMVMTLQDLIKAAQNLSWQEQFQLATRLLQWAEAKMPDPTATNERGERQPDLHPGAFVMHNDFDQPLPDSFGLGEE